MKHLIPALSFVLLACWAFGQQPAQEPEQVKEGELPVFTADSNEMATIKVDVEIVNVLCSVRNKQGGLIGSLEQQDFVLSEDGVEQEIRYFARESNLPLTIGLLISIPLIIWGSTLVLRMLDRLPFLAVLGAGLSIGLYALVVKALGDPALSFASGWPQIGAAADAKDGGK